MTQWLEAHRPEIELGKLVVLFQDECHLLWGDICGYVWGKKNERVEVPIVNEKERQTYFGAVNIATGQLCKTFAAVKYIFKLVTHYQIFDFAKLHSYGNFSRII